MKFILLCGGQGKRCNNYSLPKPLNYINGKPMIELIIQNIPSDEIYIIYNISLENYNFEEIIINLFKKKKFYFSKIDYNTRGAVESSLVGINNFIIPINEPVVFMDNDNIHSLTNFPNGNFIGYGIDLIKSNYSFIIIQNNRVINIEEKIKISDQYCCGIYGFENVKTFTHYASELINQNFKTKNEFYFSQIYKLMIKDDKIITPIEIKNTNHLGSLEEITNSINNIITSNKLRICFDLDNTLVSYPTIPNDYSSVRPIKKMINLLNDLKKKGHEIIIYTARRMKTHNNNVGSVIKDIALVTINTLEKFKIEYDELIFGKPIADIYIDDRAINPYINEISFFGIFNEKNEFIPNKVANNKYNSIKKDNDIIKKKGPYTFLKGELYFYQNIPQEISRYFPKLIDYNKINNNIEISLEYIDGIPLYFLYKNKLITYKNINNLIEILQKFHNIEYPITINETNISNNYFKKLKDRLNEKDYFFEDTNEVYDKIIDDLKKYYAPKVVGIIHGDFWFSNIIIEYNDNYKFIDMKGQIDNILTLNGDMYYDYGKLYQSILGYDLVLNNIELDNNYISIMKKQYIERCSEIKLNIDYLTAVTKSLIFGTFHSIENNDTKIRIWNFLKKI